MDFDIPAWWKSLDSELQLMYGCIGGIALIFILAVLPALLAWGGMITCMIGLGQHIWYMSHDSGSASWTAPKALPQSLMLIGMSCSVLGTVLHWIF